MPWAVATVSMPVYAGSLWWSVDEEPSLEEIPLRNSAFGWSRRPTAIMAGDRSMPTGATPWPASQAAMCPGPHPRSAIGAPIAGLLGEAGQQGPVERLVS